MYVDISMWENVNGLLVWESQSVRVSAEEESEEKVCKGWMVNLVSQVEVNLDMKLIIE